MLQTKGIEIIFGKEEKILATIIRSNFGKEGINFISKPDDPFQVGVSNYSAGLEIRPHFHNKIEKTNISNPEFIYIVKGEVEVMIYDDNSIIEKIFLKSGDMLLQINGGHGFRILENTKLIELKQGPYYGTEKEKTYIQI